MFYDPPTKLLWWWCWPTFLNQPNYSDAELESENKSLVQFHSVFVADDRLAVFSSQSFRTECDGAAYGTDAPCRS